MNDVSPVAFRRSFVRWWLVACASLFLLVFVSGLFSSWGNADDPSPLAQQLILAPFAAANAWLVVRLARRGVWASEHGLLVRNTLRTYRIQWDQVDEIEAPPPYGALRKAGIRIRLRDGSTVSADLFSAGPLSRPAHSDTVLRRLRELRDRWANPGMGVTAG